MIKIVKNRNTYKTASKKANGTYKARIDGEGGTIIVNIVDGEICGKFVTFYYRSTKIYSIIENMVNGVVNGLVTRFWSNGVVKDQCTYVDGLKDGVLYAYNGCSCYPKISNSSLASISKWSGGKLNGLFFRYYLGYTIATEYYENGERVNKIPTNLKFVEPKPNPHKIPTI